MQGLLFVAGYHSRNVLCEGAQLRLRLVLAHYLLPSQGVAPPLSRVSYLFSEVITRTAVFVGQAVQILAFVLQAGTLAVALFWLAPGEALVGLLGFAAAAAVVVGFNRRALRASLNITGAGVTMAQAHVRASRSWLLIRALRLQEGERARYSAAAHDHYRASVESFLFANLGLALTPLVALVIIAVMALARELVFGTAPAVFVVFLYLFVRFQYLLAHGSHLTSGVFTIAPFLGEAVRLVAERSDEELAAVSALRQRDHAGAKLARPTLSSAVVPTSPPRVEARDLSFAWDQERALIQALSCDLAPGCQLGIVGPNGSGKSTLLALLLGAVAPQRGTLTLDGVPAADWAACHAGALGYVGPEPCLIQGTVRDNVRYGLGRSCSDAEIVDAVEEAGFGDGLRALPGGLDHYIGENGDELSSGERQKLALARSLLRRPALLLLDEPTSNVDERSERDIVETLSRLRGHCTVVLVTHEPRVLCHADQLVRLAPSGPQETCATT
jgi:ABC-type multidrug transport system fused ATPase/permease subunit